MRVLVVGASGLVGGALLRVLGEDAVGTYHTRPASRLRPLDARDARALAALLSEIRPQVVFFPAADPNVEWCEEHPDEAYERNVVPAIAALEASRRAGARFVFFSSDYVFDGRAGPYVEGDVTAPLQVYGQHKLAVEERVRASGETVVRTTTVFGEEPPPGKNFVLRLVARLRAGERVRVPSDQVSTPTWSDELARAASAVSRAGGVWHVAGPELLARDAFARLVAHVFALDASRIEPVATLSLSQRAARPLRAGLRTDKIAGFLGGPLLAPREALARLRELVEP